MKKNLFILAAAGLALASCSSDETIATSQASNEISFRANVNGTTRAAIDLGVKTAWAAENKFNVYAEYGGSKLFQADYVTDGTNNFAPVSGNYYWPSTVDGDHKVTFTAIYGIASPAIDAPGKFTAFVPANLPENQVDVLVAKKDCSTKESPVNMVFSHALSKISVRVKNTNSALKFIITDARIGGIKNTGEFNYNYNFSTTSTAAGVVTAASTYIPRTNWNVTGNPMYFTKDVRTGETPITVDGSNAGTNVLVATPWLLLPQSVSAIAEYATAANPGAHTASTEPGFAAGAYIALKMSIQNSSTSSAIATEEWCYWPISVDWNPGYGYAYLIDLAGGGYFPTDQDNNKTTLDPVLDTPIVFSVSCTIDGWNDQDATTV